MEVAPCDSKGREYTEKDDMFVDSPDELVGKEVNFSFKIINCRGLPNKYTVKFWFKLRGVSIWLTSFISKVGYHYRMCTADIGYTWMSRTPSRTRYL